MIDALLAFIAGVYGHVLDFINDIITFISDGIYDFVVKGFAQFIKWSVLEMLQFKLMMIKFSWDVAKQLLTDLNVSSYINSAFSSLDSKVLSMLTFFRIPEAINIVASAAATKFVMRFIGV